MLHKSLKDTLDPRPLFPPFDCALIIVVSAGWFFWMPIFSVEIIQIAISVNDQFSVEGSYQIVNILGWSLIWTWGAYFKMLEYFYITDGFINFFRV